MISTAKPAPAKAQQQQLKRLAAQVEALRDQLRHAQRLAAVGTMTAMLAHEFNNILTPMVSYAQLARKNPALAEKAMNKVTEGGHRASCICQAILAITGGEKCQVETVPLAVLVDETLAAMGRELSADGIELVRNVPPDLAVTANRVQLQQVLLNLLINARSAVLAQNGSRRMEISAAADAAEGVRISLADSGIGIPPKNLSRIFEPFFTTKSPEDGNGDGHGLGLAVCREIVASMGGRIWAESRPGHGAVFTIHLPQ